MPKLNNEKNNNGKEINKLIFLKLQEYKNNICFHSLILILENFKCKQWKYAKNNKKNEKANAKKNELCFAF